MKKKLNKFIIGLGVMLGICNMSDAATIVHVTNRLLTGTYLCVSNGTTVSPTASNAWYYSYSAGTNVIGGSTNAAGTYYASPIVLGGLFPDMNADVNPNVALQIVIGYTNNLFLPSGQSPTMLNTVWTNPSPVFLPQPTATNAWSVTLTPVASKEFPMDGPVVGKSFTISGFYTNGVPMVITTNLPVALLQGCYALAPSITVGTGTNAANGVVFNAINITGWTP